MKQLTLFAEKKMVEVNVSKVPQRSPFRYPGGKTWLVPWVRVWLRKLSFRPKVFIEPFAGGAIIGLTVAFENLAEKIILIEIDDKVAAVWNTILCNDAKWLCSRINSFDLTISNAKALIESNPKNTREKAFITILKNRIYHGGILANGSGLIKNGENGKGIKSRWYPQTLVKRINAIHEHRHKIQFLEGDGISYLTENANESNFAFFIDPPYTASSKKAGKRLYRYYDINHEKLFSIAKEIESTFLMTYDNAKEIHDLSDRFEFQKGLVPMRNTHHYKMFELLISNDLGWLKEIQ